MPLLIVLTLAATVADGGPMPVLDAGEGKDAGAMVAAPTAEAPPAGAEEEDEEANGLPVPSRLYQPPLSTVKPLPPAQDLLARAKHVSATEWAVSQDGGMTPLTIVPDLQEHLTKVLVSYQTPYAAVVAMEPSTGRVLAMAEHSEADPALRGLTTKAVFPAASIFKLVTASALLDRGVTPDQTECATGGKRRVSEKMLREEGGAVCRTMTEALAKSANTIFAKLTLKHLNQAQLTAKARALHFNRPLPFDVPTDISLAAIPAAPFDLATTGAGFGDVYLSPLHAAAMASTIANGGRWVQPVLLESEAAIHRSPEQCIAPADARALVDMMEQTVLEGTARRMFRERGHEVKGAVGKTGSLWDRHPFRDYTWFVGFAPKDHPAVAVGAVIVNDAKWRIRATWLGREAMRLALEKKARPRRSLHSRRR